MKINATRDTESLNFVQLSTSLASTHKNQLFSFSFTPQKINYTVMCWYILVYIGVPWYFQVVFIGIYWYILVCTGIYCYILVYPGLYWPILLYTAIYTGGRRPMEGGSGGGVAAPPG